MYNPHPPPPKKEKKKKRRREREINVFILSERKGKGQKLCVYVPTVRVKIAFSYGLVACMSNWGT